MEEIIQILNLTKSFGGLRAVSNVSFKLQKGEVLAIIGPNGAGKSTIFNLISGLFPSDDGIIFFNGNKINSYNPSKRCHEGIGRTFQICRPFEDLNVFENICVPAVFGGKRRKKLTDAHLQVKKIIDQIGLRGKEEFVVSQLTPAQIKKVEIGRALATDPLVLLLDEMMSGLLPHESDEIVALINKINSLGVTIIMVEHVMRVVKELATRVIVLDYGKIICEGTYEEVMANELVIEAYMGRDIL